MQKQKVISNHPSILGRSIPNVQKAIARWSKKTRKTQIGSIVMRLSGRIKKRVSSITLFPLINFRLRLPRGVKKVGKEAI